MTETTLLRDAGPEAPPLTPAVRSAARAALLAEIDAAGTVRGRARARLPRRRTVIRTGAGLVAVAAAWTTTVVITPSEDPASGGSTRTPGITLVATEEITFPLSLDPVPGGMSPSFSGDAYSSDAIAGYESADGNDRFTIYVAGSRPGPMSDAYDGDGYDVAERGTVDVGGVPADLVRGQQLDVCDETGCRDRSFADLIYERAPGQWIWLTGEGSYGDLDRLVAVGTSLVDRPQPVTLQVRLAPAGWSVDFWHNSHDVGLVDDSDASRGVVVQCLPHVPEVDGIVNWTVDSMINTVTALDPPEVVEIGGRPAQLVHASDVAPDGSPLRFWKAAWQLADETVCSVTVPEDFAAADVLAIAGQVSYTP